MLDLENFNPPSAAFKCCQCQFFLREVKPTDSKKSRYVFHCRRKRKNKANGDFLYYGRINARQCACWLFRQTNDAG